MTDEADRKRAGGTSAGPAAGPGEACPMCGKPTAERYQPFCSKRCQQLDLARWLDGSYRVPSDEPADPADYPGDLPQEDEE